MDRPPSECTVISDAPADAAERAAAKSTFQYNARLWDLVDASREKDFDLAKIKDADLPEEMRKMTLAERRAYIAKKAAERAAIQEWDDLRALVDIERGRLDGGDP